MYKIVLILCPHFVELMGKPTLFTKLLNYASKTEHSSGDMRI